MTSTISNSATTKCAQRGKNSNDSKNSRRAHTVARSLVIPCMR